MALTKAEKAELLIERRLELGLTQAELGKLSGYNAWVIFHAEKGRGGDTAYARMFDALRAVECDRTPRGAARIKQIEPMADQRRQERALQRIAYEVDRERQVEEYIKRENERRTKGGAR